MRVAVLKGGRSLERTVSLRSGARVEDALERLGHDVRADRRRRRTSSTGWRGERPDVAFVALHGRGGEDGTVQELLELVGVPYTASGPRRCIRCMDKVVAKHALRDAGIPTPDFYAFSQTAFEELGAARALPAIEERLDFPIVVKPAGQGSALGIKFARTAADVPGALVAAFSYDTKVLLERYVDGPRPRGVGARRPGRAGGAAGRRGDPARGGLLRLRGALRDRPHARSSCPADLADEATARAQELALAAYRTLGCAGFARVDLMLDGDGELTVLEANAIPGLTDTSLLPLAAEAAGIGFDELVARVLDLAVARTPPA